MIYLRLTAGRQKLNDWESITNRPNFIPSIIKGEQELQEIIGHYRFKDAIHCGLAGCNQPHQMGYIVKTTGGFETNIGNVCGKNEFGVEFSDHAKNFNDYMKLEENTETISNAQNKCDEWLITLKSLNQAKPPIGFCSKYIEDIQNANHSGKFAAQEIRSLAKSTTGLVTLSELETDKRNKDILSLFANNSSKFSKTMEDYNIGKVSFIHVLRKENNLRDLYVSIDRDIKLIKNLNLNESSSPAISNASKIANALDEKLKNLKSLFHDSKQFLTKKNLSAIENKLKFSSTASEDDQSAFQNFINKMIKEKSLSKQPVS